MSITQPQLLQAYPQRLLNELEEDGIVLKLVSCDYNRGNITVMVDPLSLSSPFSFNDFVSYAFPDVLMYADPFH